MRLTDKHLKGVRIPRREHELKREFDELKEISRTDTDNIMIMLKQANVTLARILDLLDGGEYERRTNNPKDSKRDYC